MLLSPYRLLLFSLSWLRGEVAGSGLLQIFGFRLRGLLQQLLLAGKGLLLRRLCALAQRLPQQRNQSPPSPASCLLHRGHVPLVVLSLRVIRPAATARGDELGWEWRGRERGKQGLQADDCVRPAVRKGGAGLVETIGEVVSAGAAVRRQVVAVLRGAQAFKRPLVWRPVAALYGRDVRALRLQVPTDQLHVHRRDERRGRHDAPRECLAVEDL